ncbi:MAG TPA: FAD-dependent oxidoreductase [Steroidobacteraceae bacterium]|jgi:glycine/D-amino acid oxidase-like deaminating enzyme|nr:FAD-dependent oxidoreductase [Steroidobacteraceae bacterium]
MDREHSVAVIGAGVVGATIAYALAREGRSVLLLDRAEPGMAGASFGNAGHLAAELVAPLPSQALLFGFWRELFALGGPLDIPLRRVPQLLPWARRFAAASAHQDENTSLLAPLVKPAVQEMSNWLAAIGGSKLLRRNGHYEIWFGRHAEKRAAAQARAMEDSGIRTQPASPELLRMLKNPLPSYRGPHLHCRSRPRSAASEAPSDARGLWFPNTGHVIDPLQVVRAFARAADQHGAQFKQAEVRALEPHPSRVSIHTADGTLSVHSVIVCAGAWAAPLLERLGVRVPMEAVRGYHLELPNHEPVVDAPILYSDQHVLVTPMQGRLRASSFMDFVTLDAEQDPRKPKRLVSGLRRLGYSCDPAGPSWAGPRPILPDYLPAIGRIDNTNVFYATGHQHLGLTLAPVTAELVADLLAGRTPRHDLSAFDLRRFGALR